MISHHIYLSVAMAHKEPQIEAARQAHKRGRRGDWLAHPIPAESPSSTTGKAWRRVLSCSPSYPAVAAAKASAIPPLWSPPTGRR